MAPAPFDPERPTRAQAAIMTKNAAYPFRFSDGGRSMSKRPKQRNDCTVRALAVVTGAMDLETCGIAPTGNHYDAVYDLLAEDAGRKSSSGVHLSRWLLGRMSPAIGDPMPIFGWVAAQVTFPPKKGQRRMNPVTFAEQYRSGRWVVFTARHVYAVIDGVAMDTAPTYTERCIYQAWQFTNG